MKMLLERKSILARDLALLDFWDVTIGPWKKKSLEKKKGGPVAPPTGDRTLSPEGWATGPCRPLGGRQGPLMQIGTIASVAFFSYVVLYLSDYYATFDI